MSRGKGRRRGGHPARVQAERDAREAAHKRPRGPQDRRLSPTADITDMRALESAGLIVLYESTTAEARFDLTGESLDHIEATLETLPTKVAAAYESLVRSMHERCMPSPASVQAAERCLQAAIAEAGADDDPEIHRQVVLHMAALRDADLVVFDGAATVTRPRTAARVRALAELPQIQRDLFAGLLVDSDEAAA